MHIHSSAVGQAKRPSLSFESSRRHGGARRLHSSRLLGVVLATWALVAVPAALAEDRTPTFEDMVEVSEVLLDVLVTDGDGNVVLGLGPDDFIVEDDGLDLSPATVDFYSNRFELRDGETGIQKPAADEAIADRYFVLFFHDPRTFGASRLTRQHLDAARRSKQWVEKEMLPGDWVAVVSYDFKLKIQHDFSQDREALMGAIDRAAQGKDPRNQWSSRRPEEAPTGPSLLAQLPQGDDLRDKSTHMYDALTLVSEASRNITGRKSILLFTIGFGEVRNRGGLISEADPRFYPEMKQSLNDNNVAVYPINLLPSARNAQGHFLNQLAVETGGRYQETFVNFISPIRRVADESNGYYLLSYQAQHPSGEQGYREVEVRMRNPELKVRARRGYRYGS